MPKHKRPGFTSGKRLLVAGMLLVVVVAAVAIWHEENRVEAFELPTVTGQKVSVPGDGLMWINFWSATCPPCLREMPRLNVLHQDMQGRLQVVAIAAASDPPAMIKEMQDRFGFALPLALDLDGSAARRFSEKMPVPSHYLIDGRGNILTSVRGEASDEIIKSMLASYL